VENLKNPCYCSRKRITWRLELAMACHFRVDNAKMGTLEVSLGVIRIWWNTTFTAINGKGRAMEMIMTAGMVTAECLQTG
jgi:enoyl-CoA hydratase